MDALVIPLSLVISGAGACIAWAARILWQIDRRLVVVETKLGLKGES